jgi:peptide/nickel transport system substrate-binding protein
MRAGWLGIGVVAGLLGAGTVAAPALGQTGSLAQSGLVGELEGAVVLTDPAAMPRSFKEAPQLAELVRAGKLPPVAERLPSEPLVLQPVREIGRYGGTWRRGFIGPSDVENGNRIVASDRPIFSDPTGTRAVPSLAKGLEVSADGKSFTLRLRKGTRWSDGHPFTADDFVFWFEDIYSNKDIVPTPLGEMAPQGKPGRIVKVDETTVRFEFDVPYFLFEDLMWGDTQIGGGQAVRQSQGRSFGAYAPKHYLKQFLPKYSSLAEVEALAKAQGYDTWLKLLNFKKDWSLNPELPTLGPWRTVQPINTPTWVLERNPYYWAVDSAGNQLPYIDRVVLSLAESTEILNLRALAGEYDMQERHIDLGKLPVLLEQRQKSGYSVHLDLALNGADTVLQVNQSFDGDPEIRKWLTNADFRRALSLGIDRDQLNEAFFLGVAVPGSPAPAENLPYSPGSEWRTRWSTHDPKQANELLDRIGLARKDGQGFRLRTDRAERLRIEITAVKAFLPWPQQAEMIADQWRRIGIQADIKDQERGLAIKRTENNEHQIMVWTNNGTELLYLYPQHAVPVDPLGAFMGPAYAKWFASGGAQGMKPDDPRILEIWDLFRAAGGQERAGREATAREIWKILVDGQYGIGTVGQSPAFMGVRVVSTRLGNIPSRVCIAQHCRTPGGSHPETWFFKN